MREKGDFGAVSGRQAGRRARAPPVGFDLRLAIEDDPRNVAMFDREGVPCLYIHSGYYE